MDNIDISTSSKDKTSVLTNDIEVFIKEQLAMEIQWLSTANIQLVTDKMETEKAKVNLEADGTQLFKEKNSLVVKRKELRAEIAAMNTIKPFNVLTRS